MTRRCLNCQSEMLTDLEDEDDNLTGEVLCTDCGSVYDADQAYKLEVPT